MSTIGWSGALDFGRTVVDYTSPPQPERSEGAAPVPVPVPDGKSTPPDPFRLRRLNRL